eukprot:GEMP01089720.1.p2 GENE.GEMP01089720.1~~GEMP01089720.1.p2  ORF type:complete len:109 (+),score=32.31 GEMP01089720.1:123-449(+)
MAVVIPLIAGACAPGCAGVVVAIGGSVALPVVALGAGIAALAYARNRMIPSGEDSMDKVKADDNEHFSDAESEPEPEIETVKIAKQADPCTESDATKKKTSASIAAFF